MTRRTSTSVAPEVLGTIVRHARQERPRECCGFLLGSKRDVKFAVPMPNAARSETRFRIDDAAHLELRRIIRQFVPPLQIVGVYHSHPAGDAWPSETDVREAMYPDWLYLIVGLRGRGVVRGFRIRGGRIREVAITSRSS